MSTVEKNKEVIHNLYEQSFNQKNMDLLQDFISDDYIGMNGVKGVAGFKIPIDGLFRAFPDIHYNLEEIIAEGEKVFVSWKLQGTHKEQFQNIPATGKTISNTGMGIFEFKDGKIISSKIHTERLSFLQDLGVLPIDLSQLSIKK